MNKLKKEGGKKSGQLPGDEQKQPGRKSSGNLRGSARQLPENAKNVGKQGRSQDPKRSCLGQTGNFGGELLILKKKKRRGRGTKEIAKGRGGQLPTQKKGTAGDPSTKRKKFC